MLLKAPPLRSTLTLLLLFPLHTFSQSIINGSFESSGNADLSGWSYECDAPQSTSNAAPGSGSWAARVQSGNTQGCAIGYLYQLLPSINDGDVFTLSGWAFVDPNWVITNVGLFLGKRQAGNTFFLDNGVQTNSTTWTYLSITDTFHLGAGDTAAVILNAGLVGGPAIAWAQFDGIQLSPSISTNVISYQELRAVHYPNPAKNELFIELPDMVPDHKQSGDHWDLELFDLTGRNIHDMRTEIRNGRLILNTSQLTTGIYVAHISTRKGIAVVRFAKQ